MQKYIACTLLFQGAGTTTESLERCNSHRFDSCLYHFFISLFYLMKILHVDFIIFEIVSGLLVKVGQISRRNQINENMSYKEQMAEWIARHPKATIEEAWQAGYLQSNTNWCRGKVDIMQQCRELMRQLIE